VICVPTPLNKTKDPDISLIMNAADALLPHLRRGQLVVLESTTYPGFTREVLKPYLERTGYKVGRDVFLAFSPERVDPGNPVYHTKNTPKVIGGMTERCNELTQALYSHFIDTIVPVSSCDAAEMVKLLENTFRAVNIGLVNEVALMSKKLGLSTWEVIDAAASKPFGFMPFYPGPGLGGHCIPVDPHYLSWKLKTLKYQARFIELAGVINSGMPEVVVQLVADALNDRKKPVRGSRILVLGVAYKADIDDVRESPALDVLELLLQRGGDVSYHDPFVAKIRLGERELASVPLDKLGSYDCAIVVTNHKVFDYAQICKESQLVVDTRNATKGVRSDFVDKIVTL
jgi:UDP-N-acetyl-D-glucosamine dehydrogenase